MLLEVIFNKKKDKKEDKLTVMPERLTVLKQMAKANQQRIGCDENPICMCERV